MKKQLFTLLMLLFATVTFAQYRISTVKGTFTIQDLSNPNDFGVPYAKSTVFGYKSSPTRVTIKIEGVTYNPKLLIKNQGIEYNEFRDGNNSDATFASAVDVDLWFKENAGQNFKTASGSSEADGVVSNVILSGSILDFTGSNGGFDGNVDLSGLGGGSLPNNGEIYASNYSISNDGVTENSSAFATATQDSSNDSKVLVFGEGTFRINAANLERLNVNIKGVQGKTFFVGNGTANSYLFKITGGIKIEGVTFSGYDRLFYSDGGLSVLDIQKCTFKDSREELYYSAELGVSATSHIEYLNFSNNEIINTPGFFHNGTVGRAFVMNNYLNSWMRDLTIYTDETIRTRNWGIQIGNAFSADGSLTVDQTQDLIGNITLFGNTFEGMAKPISNGIDMLGAFISGQKVTMLSNHGKDIYDTNETAIDVAFLYAKAKDLTISHNTGLNVGSKGVIGEGAIVAKGYNRDGYGFEVGAQDSQTYNVDISNNTIRATLPSFHTAFWLSYAGESMDINSNKVDGYDYAYANMPSNSVFRGGLHTGLKKGLIYVNSTATAKNTTFQNETLIDFKPTVAATSVVKIRKGKFQNIIFKDFKINADLDDYTDNVFNVFSFQSNNDTLDNNIIIEDIKLNIENSSLTGGQNLMILAFGGGGTFGFDVNEVSIKTDGLENWNVKNDALTQFNDTEIENFYVNGVKKIGARLLTIYDRAKNGETVNLITTNDSRYDTYYAYLNEYYSGLVNQLNIDYVKDNLSGQTTAGWIANTSPNTGLSTYNNVVASIIGTGKNTIWEWGMGENDPSSTVAQYETLWGDAIQSVLTLYPDVTLRMVSPVYAFNQDAKYANMLQAGQNLVTYFRGLGYNVEDYVNTYPIMQSKYALGTTYWDGKHIARDGAIIHVNSVMNQTIPTHLKQYITLPKLRPYATNLTNEDLVKDIPVINGYVAYADTGEINTGAVTKRSIEIPNLTENSILLITNEGGDSKSGAFLDDFGNFKGGYTLSHRDTPGTYEIIVPSGATKFRFNVDGTDVATYDASGFKPKVYYKQNVVSFTQDELNSLSNIDFKVADEFSNTALPISEYYYNQISKSQQGDFEGYLTSTLEPQEQADVFNSLNAASIEDGTDLTDFTSTNGSTVITLETANTNGSTNAVRFQTFSGGTANAFRFTVSGLKANTTYNFKSSIYTNLYWFNYVRHLGTTDIVVSNGGVNDAWVESSYNFTTGAAETAATFYGQAGNTNGNLYVLLDNIKITEVVEPDVAREFTTDEIYVLANKINDAKVVDLKLQKALNIYVDKDAVGSESNNLQKVLKQLFKKGGASADRPTTPYLYQDYFSTDLNYNITWDGTVWRDQLGQAITF